MKSKGTIVALAGRRVDSPDQRAARFPPGNASLVYQRIIETLARVEPNALVCSAACGADLVALRAARRLGIRTRVILAFPSSIFREVSVVDRPATIGWDWEVLFDEVVAEARMRSDLVELDLSPTDPFSFRTVNHRILEEALRLTAPEEGGAAGRPVAIVVWEGDSHGDEDITAAFLDAARGRGFEVLEVLTSGSRRNDIF